MVVVLSRAGLHVPVMPLLDVVGNAVRAPPEQIGVTPSNAGVTGSLTVTSIVVIAVAHWPAAGVNV